MKVRATFVKDGKWWVAWTDDVPGASTQGRTIEAARRNLIDAIRELQAAPRSKVLDGRKIVVETIEV